MMMTMKAENSNKLKPCPFCGGKAKLHQAYNSFWQVQCNVCNIGTLITTDKERAISVWNRRTKSHKLLRIKQKQKGEDNAKQTQIGVIFHK